MFHWVDDYPDGIEVSNGFITEEECFENLKTKTSGYYARAVGIIAEYGHDQSLCLEKLCHDPALRRRGLGAKPH